MAGQGRPRQFIEMCEDSRCSILFHFEVPVGRWQTVISSPVCSARVKRRPALRSTRIRGVPPGQPRHRPGYRRRDSEVSSCRPVRYPRSPASATHSSSSDPSSSATSTLTGRARGRSWAMNGLIELHRRLTPGFRDCETCRLRMLIIGRGLPTLKVPLSRFQTVNGCRSGAECRSQRRFGSRRRRTATPRRCRHRRRSLRLAADLGGLGTASGVSKGASSQ